APGRGVGAARDARTTTAATPAIGLEAVESAARAQELAGGSWVPGTARTRTAARWFPTFTRAVRAVGRPRTARGPAPHRAQWTPANLARVPRSWRRRLVAAVAWLVVVVCATAYAVSLLVPLWFQLHDQRVLIVTSGSMSGTAAGGFDAGDAVIMRRITDPSQLRVGQVVSFWPPGSDALVTHRIVALHYLPVLRQDEATGRMLPTRDPVTGELVERPFIVTKGDANPAPDPDATPLSRVRGVVLDVYPGWGWVLAWARSAEGRFAMLVPPLVALAVMEVQSLLDSRRAPRPPRHRGRAQDDLLLG
ncbi:signal peptidase I, partial [Cellulomonas sp. 179-A 4D5 NHS]|uniref:signal peptidase I n=1 Tax=Cellulomonas sp. 179-A 4D5 NHS TaxID=3142378 RepID=UPI0039A39287